MQTVEPIRNKRDIEEIKIFLGKKRRKRDYLLFVMGINCGLRISDLLKLRVCDVKNKEFLSITEQKTGKTRRLPIRSMLKGILERYISDKNDDQWLFQSQKGNKPISRIQAYRIVRKACTKAGLSDNFGTHTLRKTFGYHFYQMTKDVALLQNVFNHSSPNITLRYIGINQDIIESQLERFIL